MENRIVARLSGVTRCDDRRIIRDEGFVERGLNPMGTPVNYPDVLAAALCLNRDERVRLLQALTDGLAEIEREEEVSSELKAELERRLAHYEAHPETGVSFDEVKAMLKSRYGL
jgi:putative addiction module component (TIGR02574 family)